MHRLWLIFAQTVTLSVAVLFTVQTLKPEWLARGPGDGGANIVAVQEAAPGSAEDKRKVSSYSDAARKALPSVVHIFTSQEIKTPRNPFLNDPFFRHFFGDRFDMQPQRRSGLGSGVIVSADGYNLTNNHVVETADEIEVATQDGRKLKARVVGADPDSDLAVVRVDLGNGSKLPAVIFAPAESLRVGDVVLAIGNPFASARPSPMASSAHSAVPISASTLSRISSDRRRHQSRQFRRGSEWTPTATWPALIPRSIRKAAVRWSIGFAIPVLLAKSVMEQIIKTGSVTRGWIGIEVQEITPELAESFKLPSTQGTLIAGVMRGSPADRAGIKPGDILLSVAGKPIGDAQSMLGTIAAQTPGQQALLKVYRAGKQLELTVTIAKRPKPRPE